MSEIDNNKPKTGGKPKAGGPPTTFSMPMYRQFVPKFIRPWIYLLLAFCFQFANGMYLGAMNDVVGEWSLMREDVQMCSMPRSLAWHCISLCCFA